MSSTYVQENPPYFENMPREPGPTSDVFGARELGDVRRQDHNRPHLPGRLDQADVPAGKYLIEHQVRPADFNLRRAPRQPQSHDARHFCQHPHQEFMLKGADGNIPEGGFAKRWPDGEQMSIYDAAMKYQTEGVPLVVFAGAEYGNGSSRDWAAKGTRLFGVGTMMCQSFERIHRSNLVGMGVLPLTFEPGTSWTSLGLKGDEKVTIRGLQGDVEAPPDVDGQGVSPPAITPRSGSLGSAASIRSTSSNTIRNGGILHYVLRKLAA